nr:hypothetical protein [Mycoplasmopsis bovis]
MTIDKEKNEIVGRPHLISRGSFYVKTSLALVEEAKRIAHGAVLYRIKNNANWNIVELKQLIIDRLEALFYKEKRRRPIIIPTFLFVKEENDPLFDKVTIKFENKNIDSKKREANQKVLKELQEEIFGSSIEFSEDFRDEVDDE